MKRRHSNINVRWKVIRNDDEDKTPVMLRINGKKTASQREIAEKLGTTCWRKYNH